MRFVLASTLVAVLLAQPAFAAQNTSKKEVSDQTRAVYNDIEATLGSVPGFIKAFPGDVLPGAWAEMKGLMLNDRTAIPNKYKDLIGLAVAAQIPCTYCIYFHTEAAKLAGATEAEIKQTLAEAGLVTRWSAFFNGMAGDEAEVRAEITQVVMNLKKMADSGKPMPEYPAYSQNVAQISTMTTEMVTKDMEQTIGFRPNFMKNFPPEALPGVWSQVKATDMNPYSAIPGKYLSLTELAVATQTGSKGCMTFAHESLRQIHNASEREMQEAVAIAGGVREWSTFLNGISYDQPTFRREVDHIMNTMKKRRSQAKPKA